MPEPSYCYHAVLVRLIDGDTCVLSIDLGFSIWMKRAVRILGVNCPEIHGATWEAGERAKRFTQAWLDAGPFVVKTHLDKADSFGRYLVEVWRGSASLATALIESGNAVEYVK